MMFYYFHKELFSSGWDAFYSAKEALSQVTLKSSRKQLPGKLNDLRKFVNRRSDRKGDSLKTKPLTEYQKAWLTFKKGRVSPQVEAASNSDCYYMIRGARCAALSDVKQGMELIGLGVGASAA